MREEKIMKKKIHRYGWLGFVLMISLVLIWPAGATVKVSYLQNQLLPPLPDPQKNFDSKLDFTLQRLTEIYLTTGLEKTREFAAQHKIELKGDSVRVVAEAETGHLGTLGIGTRVSLISHQIEAFGGKVETTYEHLIQHLAPIRALPNIARLPMISRLRLPFKPIPLVITSEGVSKTGANSWQSIGAYRTQENVKVCILDLGFKGYTDLLGSELPSSVTPRSFRADNDIEADQVHGAACAEIVHDMAPDAELYFVNFNTDVEHHNAVSWIMSQGAKVISYSIGWFNAGDGRGTGPICDDVKRASDAGIVWCNSAGNAAEDHWEGNFYDPDNDKLMNFSASGELLQTYGTSCSAWMNWDDWGTWNGSYYSGSSQDFDLYLYYYEGGIWKLIMKSEGAQTGTQEPAEFVGASANVPLHWALAIRKYKATRNCRMELFTSGSFEAIQYNVPAGSITIPADSPYAVTVGATDCMTDAYHTYSSRGPTHDGRIKPDFAAPSGVSTVSYGMRGFYGTSASAPHMAGAFALISGKTPYSLDQIRSILDGRALDLGSAGKDNAYGLGRLKLTR
jgi:subtilisin family serine protease